MTKNLVDFSIDFAFKSRILGIIVGMVFSVATEKMVGAFESRAKYQTTYERTVIER